MTHEQLEREVIELRKLTESLMLALWHSRGTVRGVSNDLRDMAVNLDGIGGKIEKELKPHFEKWLEKKKPVA